MTIESPLPRNNDAQTKILTFQRENDTIVRNFIRGKTKQGCMARGTLGAVGAIIGCSVLTQIQLQRSQGQPLLPTNTLEPIKAAVLTVSEPFPTDMPTKLTVSPTGVLTDAPTATSVDTPSKIPTSSLTPSPVPTDTDVPISTDTSTSTPSFTNTYTLEPANTTEPAYTSSPVPSDTAIPTPTDTLTSTSIPTSTFTLEPTSSSTPEATHQLSKNGKFEILGTEQVIPNSVWPGGIAENSDIITKNIAKTVGEIYNGATTQTSNKGNLNKLAAARAYAEHIFGLTGKIDTNTLTQAQGGVTQIQIGNTTLARTSTDYFRATGSDNKGALMRFEIYDTAPTTANFTYNQIALRDNNTGEAFVVNGKLTSKGKVNEKVYVVYVYDKDNNVTGIFTFRDACGNIGNIVRPIPQPTHGATVPPQPTPTSETSLVPTSTFTATFQPTPTSIFTQPAPSETAVPSNTSTLEITVVPPTTEVPQPTPTRIPTQPASPTQVPTNTSMPSSTATMEITIVRPTNTAVPPTHIPTQPPALTATLRPTFTSVPSTSTKEVTIVHSTNTAVPPTYIPTQPAPTHPS